MRFLGRFLGRLLVVLLGLAVVLTAVAFLLPRQIEVERSITIAAPPEAVFARINSLQEFAEWSPWRDIDPAMTQSFSGPDSGVGNRMEWASLDPMVGSGTQEITLSEPNTRVESTLDFGASGKAKAWQALAPVAGGTEVTWGLSSDVGMNPVGRYMGLLMDGWVGADYERGLANLKAIAEAQ